MSTLQEQLDQIKLEQAKFELEEMKLRATEREQKKADAVRRQKQIALDEESAALKTKQLQSVCNHRKGGKDRQGLWTGNSNDYAVVHHVFPLGDEWVICARCNKTWKPTDEGYAEAMRWPTDNVTSSSVTFSLQGRV